MVENLLICRSLGRTAHAGGIGSAQRVCLRNVACSSLPASQSCVAAKVRILDRSSLPLTRASISRHAVELNLRDEICASLRWCLRCAYALLRRTMTPPVSRRTRTEDATNAAHGATGRCSSRCFLLGVYNDGLDARTGFPTSYPRQQNAGIFASRPSLRRQEQPLSGQPRLVSSCKSTGQAASTMTSVSSLMACFFRGRYRRDSAMTRRKRG